MNPEIRSLSEKLHELHLQIMAAEPWDEGYGEVVAIHDFLLKTLRDRAQEDYSEFKTYLTQTAKDIEATWSSNSSMLQKWSEKLRPIFQVVESIISGVVPLLALL